MTYVHDCDDCWKLGSYTQANVVYDLYWCSTNRRKGSVLARYGSEGWHYLSMDVDVLLDNGHLSDSASPLMEALSRWIDLLMEEEP